MTATVSGDPSHAAQCSGVPESCPASSGRSPVSSISATARALPFQAASAIARCSSGVSDATMPGWSRTMFRASRLIALPARREQALRHRRERQHRVQRFALVELRRDVQRRQAVANRPEIDVIAAGRPLAVLASTVRRFSRPGSAWSNARTRSVRPSAAARKMSVAAPRSARYCASAYRPAPRRRFSIHSAGVER